MSLKIRANQLITTFGPGSIIDFPNLSVMPVSVKHWSIQNSHRIEEPRLALLLGVKCFYTPPQKKFFFESNDIPIQFFPTYVVCPRCQFLGHLRFLSRSLRHYRSGLKCKGCNSRLYPARFIMACEKGHIDDFPWSWWVHRGKSDCPGHKLKSYSMGRSSGLEDIMVECLDCNAKRNMAGSLSGDALKKYHCTGRSPWLEVELPELKSWYEKDTSCGEFPRALQRGASNVYFSVLQSAISIPQMISELEGLVRKKELLNSSFVKEFLKTNNDTMLKKIIDSVINDDPVFKQFSFSEILRVVKEVHTPKTESEPAKSPGALRRRVRLEEWDVLSSWSKIDDKETEFTKEAKDPTSRIIPYIDQLCLIKRLHEVRALLGFTRIQPPNFMEESQKKVVKFSKDTNGDWLPAVEVRGEGIFFRFNIDRVKEWKTHYSIYEKFKGLCGNYRGLISKSGWVTHETITPEFILAHSTAHSLIRQLSLNSGYSSASLRERIYALTEDKVGVLIYTSSSDSDGSLGGLVSQAEEGNFTTTLIQALNEAAWCSSDPLCIETKSQGINALNLAACHACLLVSETSCEERNQLLDRACLVGTLEEPEMGFFKPLIE